MKKIEQATNDVLDIRIRLHRAENPMLFRAMERFRGLPGDRERNGFIRRLLDHGLILDEQRELQDARRASAAETVRGPSASGLKSPAPLPAKPVSKSTTKQRAKPAVSRPVVPGRTAKASKSAKKGTTK